MASANPFGNLGSQQIGNADVMRELQTQGFRPPQEVGGYIPQYAAVDAFPDFPATFQQGQNGQAMWPPGFDPFQQSREAQEWLQCKNGERIIEQRESEPFLTGEGKMMKWEEYFEGYKWVHGYQPIVKQEKYYEVPHTIVKEVVREVIKPEIVERVIEVPKLEYVERTQEGPPRIIMRENLVEVPEIVTEERVVHVPKIEVQERLIEIPKVEFRERIEYEDRIEYREVPVDKIIEIPEIEYRIKEVEQLVPQTYVQEYPVDKYSEVPIMQVQEVERIEQVPVIQKRPRPTHKSTPMRQEFVPQMTVQKPVQMVSVMQQPKVQTVAAPPLPPPRPVQTVTVQPQPVQVAKPVQTVVAQPQPLRSQTFVAPPVQATQPVYSVPTQQIVQSYATYEPLTAPASPRSSPQMVTTVAPSTGFGLASGAFAPAVPSPPVPFSYGSIAGTVAPSTTFGQAPRASGAFSPAVPSPPVPFSYGSIAGTVPTPPAPARLIAVN